MQFHIKSLLVWTTVVAIFLGLRDWSLNAIGWAFVISHCAALFGPLLLVAVTIMLAPQKGTSLDWRNSLPVKFALQLWLLSIAIVVLLWVWMYFNFHRLL